MNLLRTGFIKRVLQFLCLFVVVILVWQCFKKVPIVGDWQDNLSLASTAEFSGDLVTVRNVRNFRYYPTKDDMHPGYYDRTYDLTQLKKVWFIAEPFNENQLAAHTFVSFEFNNGDFLAISIEARRTKSQTYSMWSGMFNSYPLIYVAVDERDAVLLRANLRKDKVYVYPVKLEKSENAKLLLVDMLKRMNELTSVKPAWYNTFFANCTSSIAKHINNVSPGRISMLSWQLWLTASADELAINHGLLDTDLSIDEARIRFSINEVSQKIGDISDYSAEIRRFLD
ncbi:MAG: DUF4105 domain-containing protein [Candidatus Taylorbacteria bacterium]|nr:DUF4105 domain-containing protein [Candidatus Taylorbacteria bacterium]